MPSREHRLARGGLLLLLAQQPAAALVISQPLRSAAPLRAAPPVAMAAADLAPGDKVAIIGASGNVGRLVALRLASSFKVAAMLLLRLWSATRRESIVHRRSTLLYDRTSI